MRSDIEEHLSFLEERLTETEHQIEEAVENGPIWREEEELLCSIPGVAETTAHILMAELPELGEANRQEIAKLAGVAPLNRNSGQHRGQCTTWGGRTSVRRALYMAALSATQHNEKIQSFYNRFGERGKAKIGIGCLHAETACNHEHDDEKWDPLGARISRLFRLTFNTVANRRR